MPIDVAFAVRSAARAGSGKITVPIDRHDTRDE
jgi:hypothetical protein